MRRFKLFIYIFIILISFSCSDESMFLSASDPLSGLGVRVSNQTSIIAAGEQLDIEIINGISADADLSLKVALFGADGEAIFDTDIENLVDFNYVPSIIVPDLESGYYYFIFTINQVTSSNGDIENSEVLSYRKEFFIYNSAPSIIDLTSYPAVLYPETGGLIFASFSEFDPSAYVRWELAGQLYLDGYLADGLDHVFWQAPAIDGIYTMSVKLYPRKIPAGFSQITEAASYAETQLFVSKDQVPAFDGITAESGNYLSLFHFQGEYKDYISLKKSTPEGSPELSFKNNIFGYSLTEGDGFNIDYSILPYSENGIDPFTLIFKGNIKNSDSSGQLFFNDTGDSAFTLFIDGEGKPVCTLTISGQMYTSRVLLEITPSEINTLSLSIIPKGRTIEFRWFINGLQVWDDEFEYNIHDYIHIEGQGNAVIAGENGISGIIDEFGIYYLDKYRRKAPNSDIFFHMKKNLLGDDLVTADGFDGIYLNNTYNSSASINQGVLYLKSGEFIELQDIEVEELTRMFDLQYNHSASSILKFTVASGNRDAEFIVDYLKKTVTSVKDGKSARISSSLSENITFNVSDFIVSASVSDLEFDLLKVQDNAFSLKIENTGKNTISLDNLAIIKETKAIIGNDLQSADEVL